MFSDYPITIFLIAANAIISMMAFSNASMMDKMIMWPYRVKREGEYHRMITSGFLHADFVHLFFNMFTLFFFGRALEIQLEYYNLGGKWIYLILYFTALVVSDLPTFKKHADNYHYRSLGASGAVSAVVFAAIVFNPWSSIYLYGAIKISALLYAVLFVWYCIYMGKKGQDNVNHDAHLWGAVYGFVFMIVLLAVKDQELLSRFIEALRNPSIFGNT
jgi:membrane associated rhomboid family serine protease